MIYSGLFVVFVSLITFQGDGAFNKVDNDNSGSVSKAEVQEALKDFGNGLDSGKLFKVFTATKHREINKQEFVKVWCPQDQSRRSLLNGVGQISTCMSFHNL